MEQYLKSGLVSDSKVLDIRQVDISSAKLLEVNDQTLPVFVVTFNTQEVRAIPSDSCFRLLTKMHLHRFCFSVTQKHVRSWLARRTALSSACTLPSSPG
jgi:hypothetical protein